jgi:hypothetical protein
MDFFKATLNMKVRIVGVTDEAHFNEQDDKCGTECGWVDSLVKYEGQVGTIVSLSMYNKLGIEVLFDDEQIWSFPPTCVEEASDVQV